jgi:hypothetical protein
MDSKQPLPISAAEWDEIAAIPEIRQMWDFTFPQGGEKLASLCYGGAKFHFSDEASDLFVIVGEYLTTPPACVVRNNGLLIPVVHKAAQSIHWDTIAAVARQLHKD